MNEKQQLIVYSIVIFIAILFISIFVLNLFPISGDEYSYIFQSKIFSKGKLYFESPELKGFYDLHHVVNNGKWFTKYQFFWPLILTFGELIKLPYLINPLIGILTLLMIYNLTKLLFDKNAAKLSFILLGSNPFFLFNSASFFTHPLSLLLTVCFIYCFFKILELKNTKYSILAGLALGFLILTRFSDVIILSIPITTYAMFKLYKNKKLTTNFAIIGIIALFFLGIQLYLNYTLNNNPFLFSYQIYNPKDNISFNHIEWGLNATIHNLKSLIFWFPFCIFLPFIKHGKKSSLLISIFVLNILFYLFYFSAGGDQYGPRYYYISLVALIPLISSKIKKLNKKTACIILLVNISLSIIFGAIIYEEVLYRKQPFDYFEKNSITNNLIFLKSSEYQGCSWYTRNEPDLSKNIIVCDNDEYNNELIKLYPNKNHTYYDLEIMGKPTSKYHDWIVH